MIIQYCSDLHLEFKENSQYIKRNPLPVAGDVLILGGDILLFSQMEQHRDFFKYLSDNFKTTYWIPGNHEYYQSDISQRSGILHEKIHPNVHLVNNIALKDNDCRLIFSTLWSKVSESNSMHVQNGMSDFKVIQQEGKPFSVNMFNELHDECLKFISGELAKPSDVPSVVVSHHVPTFRNYPPRYRTSVLNEGFATELSPLIEMYQPGYWIYGHIHYNIPEFCIGGTRMITNQLGYVRHHEHSSFRPDGHISF